jgi:NAD(P)-dependent dehydrogenase (short-subunit alcohol dehydrogenase family)
VSLDPVTGPLECSLIEEAIVGASSQGLGKASALALAHEGARVTICVRNGAQLEAAVTKSVVRHEKRWGRIIGIQSTSVKQPVENIDLSNGIRPGIAGLMKAIMPYLAKDGITINLVLPANL